MNGKLSVKSVQNVSYDRVESTLSFHMYKQKPKNTSKIGNWNRNRPFDSVYFVFAVSVRVRRIGYMWTIVCRIPSVTRFFDTENDI